MIARSTVRGSRAATGGPAVDLRPRFRSVRWLRTGALVVVATGVPFGVFVGLMNVAFSEGWDGLRAAAVAGIGFGVVMALILATLDTVANRGVPPGTPTGPRQSTTCPLRPGCDLPDRIRAALLSLPATVTLADAAAGRYEATTRSSWRSWGEHLTVQVSGDPAAPRARVTSRPRMPTVVVDYGRGRSNVLAVADALQS
jgi:hypothetical protein